VSRPAAITLGAYELHERIGEGGSGQVYRATGPTGTVAVKILGPAGELDAAARARFDREIATLAQLSHPNLVQLVDRGTDPDLGSYLVLPLLAGINLRGLCSGKSLCPEAALLLLAPIIAATAALHDAGFVHRDLKPENAIAAPDGTITVIDLGLAWSDGMTRHTDTGAAVGSVGYMAPEQIDGRPVGGAADVWALGVMLYEWIAGKRPFQRARPSEEAAAVMLASSARLDAVDRRCSAALADLVASCLALDPKARPTAQALGDVVAAQIDWTDDVTRERATAVADPVGYVGRVAAFRVRQLERLAEDALADAKPFVALACCDRALAYTPDHAPLLELVTRAEAATARARPAKPTERWRWKWPAIALAGCAVATTAAVALVSRHPTAPADPWGGGYYTPPSQEELARAAAERDKDRELLKGTFTVMGGIAKMFDRHDQVNDPLPGAPPGSPTTARGWLQQARRQDPHDAVISLRYALEIDPDWDEAAGALCRVLRASKDSAAHAACKHACELGDGNACKDP
jgi:hypothetical protein